MLKNLSLFLAFAIFFMSHAYATVETGTDKGQNYSMKYPLVYTQNKAAQDKINQDIYRYIAKFRSAHQSGEFYGQFSYETKYEDNDVVSLVIITKSRVPRGDIVATDGLVYDKRTGQRIPLSNYLRVTVNDLRGYYGSHLYTYSGEKVRSFGIEPDEVSSDYFLLGKGGIALIYGPYALGPYAAGTLTIRFDAKEVEYYNSRNR